MQGELNLLKDLLTRINQKRERIEFLYLLHS